MTVTAAQLKARHPATAGVSDPEADMVIAAATARCNATSWGDNLEEGVMLLAAHLITVSPAGTQGRLKDKQGGSIYWVEYKALMHSCVMGITTT